MPVHALDDDWGNGLTGWSDNRMEDILELAGRLGRKIAEDSRGRRLSKARAELEADQTARDLLASFNEQQQKMLELEANGRPIEPEDKRRMADLHARVISSILIKDLLRAEADYAELMAAVSAKIEDGVFGKQ